MLSVELFGGLRIRSAVSDWLNLPPQQTGSLLAFLALHTDHSHPRDELCALLWPDADTEEARQRLRQALYSLRRQMQSLSLDAPGILLTTRATVRLDPARVQTDVAAFEKAVRAAAETADLTLRVQFLRDALHSYRGPLLPGFYLDPLIAERNRLAQVHRKALRDLALALEQKGDFDGAVTVTQTLVAQDPLMEEAHCDLMRLYSRKGQFSSTIRQYQELQRILQEELGEEPSAETRALLDTLRRGRLERPSGSVVDATALAGARELNADVTQPAPELLPYAGTDRTFPGGPRRRRGFPAVLAATLTVLAVIAAGGLWYRAHRARRTVAAPVAIPAAAIGGAPEWVYRYPPATGDEDSEATAITVGPDNGILVTGFIRTAKHDVDYLTIKLSPDGKTKLWERRHNGDGNDVDRARCVAVDPDGNVYVAGETENGKGNGSTNLSGLDWIVIKYGPDGRELWKRPWDGGENGEDVPAKLLLGRDGGIYVVGRAYSKRTGHDAVVVKYRPDGTLEWQDRYDGPAHKDDFARAAAFDREGNLYVAGSSGDLPSSGPESDYLLIRYSRAGEREWVRPYGAGNRSDDGALAVGVDGGGNAVVVGVARGAPGTLEHERPGCVTVRYSPSGEMTWARGATTEKDRLTQVQDAIIGDGSAVLGYVEDAAIGARWRIVARDASCASAFVWTGPDVGGQAGPAALCSAGVWLVATGSSHGTVGELEYWDIATFVVAGGNEVRRWSYAGHSGPDFGRVVTFGNSKGASVLVAGQSGGGKTRDLVVLQYRL